MKKITLLISSIAFGLLIAVPTNAASTLTIAKFEYDSPGNDNSNKNAKYVVLQNISGKTIDLHNWKVSDKGSKNKLTLENLNLKKNESVTIYSGKGQNTLSGKSKKVYWNSRSAVWNNDSDELTVKNAKGAEIFKYIYRK